MAGMQFKLTRIQSFSIIGSSLKKLRVKIIKSSQLIKNLITKMMDKTFFYSIYYIIDILCKLIHKKTTKLVSVFM